MDTHSNENNSGVDGRGLRGPRFYRFRWEYWNKFWRGNIWSKKWSWRYYNRWYWEQVVENSVQLERLPRVIFKDENDIRHSVTDPGALQPEIRGRSDLQMYRLLEVI